MASDLERQPISFPDWSQKLTQASLPPAQISAFRGEIFSFLHHCRDLHAPATIALARR
jgi:hypothetical protein